MARSDDPGELLLGFDMAPVLPGRKGSPSVRRTNPVPRSGSSIRSTLQDSTVGLPTEVPDAPSFGSRPPVSDSPDPEVLSVAQLTRKITGLLEDGIGFIRVEGEISNLRRQSSGHCYFTLKDEESQLSCVLFARSPGAGAEELREGAHVELHGRITVYRPRGQYQLVVSRVQGVGEGRLRARFEELKRRLEGEGLFDQSRKRPLPRFPHRIGVVTSPSGAAIRDFLHVLHRRHPGLRVVIHPVRVQGKGAAAEIAAAVKMFSSPPAEIGPVDVVVVTRGGGSLEDLWEFNEEAVARAIAACSVRSSAPWVTRSTFPLPTSRPITAPQPRVPRQRSWRPTVRNCSTVAAPCRHGSVARPWLCWIARQPGRTLRFPRRCSGIPRG